MAAVKVESLRFAQERLRTLRWTVLARRGILSDMTIRNLVVMHRRGEVMAFERRTGSLRWRCALDADGGPLHITFAGESLVLVASEQSLTCIGYECGTLLWRAPIAGGDPLRTTLLVDDGFVLVARDRSAECFDTTGRRLWTRAVEVTSDWSLGAM